MNGYDLTDFLDEDDFDSMTMQEYIEEDERTRENIREDALHSEGKEIFFDIKSLYTTLNMVNKNYRLLCKKRNEFRNKGADYWLKNDIDPFFREYLRRLHNYTASVHTLISHTYTFLDRYEEQAPELKPRYFEELRSRNLEKKVDLLKQIRHYTQKRWEPPLSALISPAMDDEGEENLDLHLKKDEMLEWDGWDSDVRDFLEDLDDEIEITELAIDYQTKINDFYDWFRTFVLSVFYDDLMPFFSATIILNQERV